MSLPSTGFGRAATEAALIEALRAAAAAKGWTTYTVGTTPANSVWFRSNGEDGCSLIAGGLVSTTTGRMRGATAVDVNSYGLTVGGSASVGGYTNNDTGGLAAANRVQAITPDTTTAWETRDGASQYTYAYAISLDSIACVVDYTAAGVRTQGVIYIGKTEPTAGRLFSCQAKAKIDSVGAGSNGTQRLVTLDRDITAMLKDLSSWPNDPYQMKLLFQVGETPSAAADFGLVQRIGIVSGTLTTTGGKTAFEILVTGNKLDSATGRYANNRGAGDLVRLMNETNVVLCAADSSGSIVGAFTATSQTALAAWDGYCGQGAALNCALANRVSSNESDQDPVGLANEIIPYRMHVVTFDQNTSLIAQADGQGKKDVGALINLCMFANSGRPNFSFVRLDARAEERWRILEHVAGAGIAPPSFFGASDGVYAVGPGW